MYGFVIFIICIFTICIIPFAYVLVVVSAKCCLGLKLTVIFFLTGIICLENVPGTLLGIFSRWRLLSQTI